MLKKFVEKLPNSDFFFFFFLVSLLRGQYNYSERVLHNAHHTPWTGKTYLDSRELEAKCTIPHNTYLLTCRPIILFAIRREIVPA